MEHRDDAAVKILAGMFRNAFMPDTNRERALVLMRDEDLAEARTLLREHIGFIAGTCQKGRVERCACEKCLRERTERWLKQS